MAGDKITSRKYLFETEGNFERIILENKIFDDYFVFDIKNVPLNMRMYKRYADVLLINKDLKYWSIAEVEISHHSFSQHIFPQLLELQVLIEKNKEAVRELILGLEFVKENGAIEKLIKFNDPFFTLIIDHLKPKYRTFANLLSSLCSVIIINTWKDDFERNLYSIERINEKTYQEKKVPCFIKKNLLYIEKPNFIEMHYNDDKYVLFKGNEIPLRKNNVFLGENPCVIWVLNEKMRSGKYYIQRVKGELNLIK